MTNLTETHPIVIEEPTETISFETVTVNEYGEVIERKTFSALQFVEELPGEVALPLVAIPSGFFRMGSRAGEGCPDETPQHTVRVHPFYLSRSPITQAQWIAVMKKLPPCRFHGDNLPVDRVSWKAAQAWCKQASILTGREYRLPSEAEWEYACRAGTSTPFCFGKTITTDLVNYVGDHLFLNEPKGVYRHAPNEAGTYPPNAFGVYDMHGNMWEWCNDTYHDSYEGASSDSRSGEEEGTPTRGLRGGCWHDTPQLCRSASRLSYLASEQEDYTGFRVAVTTLNRIHPSGLGSSSLNRLPEPVKRVIVDVQRWLHIRWK